MRVNIRRKLIYYFTHELLQWRHLACKQDTGIIKYCIRDTRSLCNV